MAIFSAPTGTIIGKKWLDHQTMASTIVEIDARQITDWASFHDVFDKVMGFPDFYGRNMDAWIDCMTSLDDPDDGLTSVHAPSGGVLVLHVEHIGDLANRCPDIYEAIVSVRHS